METKNYVSPETLTGILRIEGVLCSSSTEIFFEGGLQDYNPSEGEW